MSTGNSINFSAGVDLTPLQRDFARAEQLGRQHAATVQRAIQGPANAPLGGGGAVSRFESLFRRSPHLRAERAIGGFISDLTTGNVEGALAGITHRMTGLGLAAGVGIGAAAVVAHKLFTQLQEVDVAAQAVRANLARPLFAQAALGAEGVGSELETARKAGDELATRRKTIGGQLREAAIAGQPDFFNTSTMQVESPDRVSPAQRLQEANLLRQKALVTALVNSYKEEAAAQDDIVNGSERENALAKIHREEVEKRAQLRLRPVRDFGDAAIIAAGTAASLARENALKQATERRFDIKREELDLEGSILKMKDSGLTRDQQSIRATQAHIVMLRDRLAGPGTIEQKRELGTQIDRMDDDLSRAQFAHRNDPGPALSTPESREENLYQAWKKDRVARRKPSWESLFPMDKRPRIFLNDDTDSHYKNLIPQDTGDLERGPMGTDRLGLPRNAISKFLDFTSAEQVSMLHATSATGPEASWVGKGLDAALSKANPMSLGGSDKSGNDVGNLGAPGVLDRIESKFDTIFSNR